MTRGMAVLLHDFKYAIRLLRKDVVTAVAAIAALALGIGATTTIFSVVYAAVLRPLPFDPDNRIASLRSATRDGEMGASGLDFQDWQRQARSFEAMAAYRGFHTDVAGGAEPERVPAAAVTPEFYRVAGVEPIAGRLTDSKRNQSGSVVISERLWKTQFGGARDAIGRVVRVGGEPLVIAAVLPSNFSVPPKTDVWMTLDLSADDTARSARNFHVIGRLRPDGNIPGARAEMNTITRRLAAAYPQSNEGVGARVISLHEETTGFFRPTLWLLWSVAILVLLIGCLNVANILLARVYRRSGEIATRAALGATPGRVVRQVVTESGVLALAGGLLGIVGAWWATRILLLFPVVAFVTNDAATLNPIVLAFAIVVSLLTALGCGIPMAVALARTDPMVTLRRATVRGSNDTLRRLFLISQVALSVALLVVAGMSARVLLRLQNQPAGFEPRRLMIVELEPDASTNTKEFFQDLLDRLKRLPGIVSVAGTTELPIGPDATRGGFVIEGRPALDEQQWPTAAWQVVTDAYFRTLKIPVVRGREFNPSDGDSMSMVIVNETLARWHWPNGDAIGQRIAIPGLDRNTFEKYKSGSNDWMTVIGIAGDVRRLGTDAPPEPQLYVPFSQRPPEHALKIAVRSSLAGSAIERPIKRVAREVAPDLPLRVRPLSSIVSALESGPRVRSLFTLALTAVALLLVAFGSYATTANWVERRISEIGVRMAMGARPRAIVMLLLRATLSLAGIGFLAGAVLSFVALKVGAAFLVGLAAPDVPILAVAAATVVVTMVVATIVPLRRAVAVDPAIVLRYE